MKLEAMVKCKV